jgi:hypothetical protein
MIYITNLPDNEDQFVCDTFARFGVVSKCFRKPSFSQSEGAKRWQPGLLIEMDSEDSAERATHASLDDQMDKQRVYKIWRPARRLLRADWPSLVTVADQIKVIIESESEDGSILLNDISQAHRKRYGTLLEASEYGFSTVMDLLSAMPQVVRLKKRAGQIHVFCADQAREPHDDRVSSKRPARWEPARPDAGLKQRRANRSNPAKSATRGASPPVEPLPPPSPPSSELTEAGSGSGLSGSCSSDSDASMAVIMPAMLECGMVVKVKEQTDQFLQFMSSTLPTSSDEDRPSLTAHDRILHSDPETETMRCALESCGMWLSYYCKVMGLS